MSRKKTDNGHPPVSRRPSEPETARGAANWFVQREFWGLVLIGVGMVTLIALLARNQGKLSDAWSLVLRQIFGVGAYPVGLFMVLGGLLLLFWNALRERFTPRWQAVIGFEVFFFCGLGLLHVLAREPALDLARDGRYGGYIGWMWWQLLVPLLGRPLSILILAIPTLLGAFMLTGLSWRALAWRVRRALVGLRARIESARARRSAQVVASPPPSPAPSPQPRRVTKPLPSSAPPAPTPRPATAPRAPAAPRPAPAEAPPARPVGGLPPLDILAPDQATDGDEGDARLKAQIIEETLAAFGIPAKVMEWHRGPVVTQFGVEPGYVEQLDRDGTVRRFKIRVSKILSLTNDLALALAAAPIRIEAPVPGRSLVGIEVPNATKSVVGLRGVLESNAFRKMRSPLRFALGRDVSGEPVVADLASMPHLLLAGATGSGKSVCLNAIVASFLFFNPPSQLKFLLIDPKRVELSRFNGIPHLIAPVVVDIEKVIVALRWVTREMERRYKQFAETGARNLAAYNKLARSKGLEPLPMIVVVIDELADLMLSAPEDVERTICRLAQMARATGIHLVIATQRPSVDVVTGLIKANFPARISFAVTSQVDSRVILDTPGAEKLLGRGDMLFMAPDASKLQRIQGCYVLDKELDALVAFWRNAQPSPGPSVQPAPWEDMPAENGADDELLQQAIALVRQHNQASASFLQRQMRIGYPRAARLMDQLEKMGIVGPSEGGGKTRVILDAPDTSSDHPPPGLPGEGREDS